MNAPRSTWTLRLRAISLLIGVFITGTVAGVGLGRWWWGRHPHHPPGGLPYDQLNLTSEQQERVHRIFEAHKGDVDAIMREARPRLRVIQDAVDKEVRLILDAEQTRKLDAMRTRGPMRPEMGGGGMGPPPRWPGDPDGGPPPPDAANARMR